MSSRPWMPLYVTDYLTDTLDLSAEENGVYLLLLMIAWRRQDGALPNDMKFLQRSLASCCRDMHGNRFNRIVPPLLERFFDLGEDGLWRNKRLTKEREKSEKLSGKQKENAEKRWSKARKDNDLGDADAMPSQSQSQSQEERKHIRVVASATHPVESPFEEFWKGYPRRQGANPKEPARKQFEAAVKQGADPKEIIAGARRCAEVDSRNVGTPYIPQAVKWLRDKRWQDYPPADGRPSADVVPLGFYAPMDSKQLDAWDEHSRRTTGKSLPRDSKGGWRVPSEWPPGWQDDRPDEPLCDPPSFMVRKL